MIPFRPTHLAAAVVFACLLLWYTLGTKDHANPVPTSIQPTNSAHTSGNDEPSFYEIPTGGTLLGHHGIANLTKQSIQVARVRIDVSQSDMISSPLMQTLDINLPASSEVDISDIASATDSHADVAKTTVHIPHISHDSPDASEFMFGVATTYERLEESLSTFAHWLGDTSARLVGHMQPSLDPDAEERVLKKAKELRITLGIVESRYEYLDRYFAMLKVLHDNKGPNTKWYVFIDDDTFFPDLSKLVSTFTKYNPSQPWYIGALTEDFQQMGTWGYMAYGGGGIFLSAPLVEQLLPHWDECYGRRNTGDRMLAQCIYQHTTTKFTWEPNLHQLDLHGDQSGFYEALREQPLSLHHWKSTEFRSLIDMYNMSRVATVCGNSCLLQKFKFANSWVLTNGFSLVKYSDNDLRLRDLVTDISMERTWDFYYAGASNAHFEHSLGPIRKPDQGGKISFRLESALVESDGRVRQLYVKRRRREGEYPGQGEVEGVVEVEWSMA